MPKRSRRATVSIANLGKYAQKKQKVSNANVDLPGPSRGTVKVQVSQGQSTAELLRPAQSLSKPPTTTPASPSTISESQQQPSRTRMVTERLLLAEQRLLAVHAGIERTFAEIVKPTWSSQLNANRAPGSLDVAPSQPVAGSSSVSIPVPTRSLAAPRPPSAPSRDPRMETASKGNWGSIAALDSSNPAPT
ncbi:hypothetical protein C8Q79DRAFT_1114472 [Trametes meyenii]|nr:hypothetical protein C8Q79DRAFT_1114472 [Trametes meyenii]